MHELIVYVALLDGLLLLITIGDDDGMGSNYYLYVQSFSAGNSSRVCTVFIAFRGSDSPQRDDSSRFIILLLSIATVISKVI